MSIGGGLDGSSTKMGEGRKPQNPEHLRAQEQKVTHDKVGELSVSFSNSGGNGTPLPHPRLYLELRG